MVATDINIQKRAIQLPVATRGVGIIAAYEYNKMCTHQNFESIQEICTIYQYYRVCLYLVYYKLHLAELEQYELPSFNLVKPFILGNDICQILSLVRRVSRGMYFLLRSIGKIKTSENIWHSIPIQNKAIDGEEAALYLYPFNIREYLQNLSDPNFNPQYRNRFHELNPLPGADWCNDTINGWILQNADVIWPADYAALHLMNDVQAFTKLLIHFEGRSPKFCVFLSWNGTARTGGTVSMKPSQVRLEAKFQPPSAEKHYIRERDVYGRSIDVEVPVDNFVYQGDTIHGESDHPVKIWSPEARTSDLELQIGAAVMVGENFDTPTRLESNASITTSVEPAKYMIGRFHMRLTHY